ncbi:MAG: cell division protein [Bdellovibrionaceae bacterium]|nr:cell division protein [Pseudobdellovibrionaceae bacterium]
MKSRILIIFIIFSALWSLLLFRAAHLQLTTNDRLRSLQNKQFKSVISLQSRRGPIVDRQGRELALSTTSFSLYADPKLLEEKKKTAKKIAKLIGQSSEAIFAKIKDPDKRFVWIERFMDDKKAKELKELKIKGLGVVEEWKRIYPNDGLLAHTLGFVGNEGQGLEGLELEKNHWLQGTKRKIAVRRDARGRPLMVDGLLFAENPEGAEVKLTIDSELQYQLESELNLAKHEYEALSAVGIILDAKTSAVRALAVVPGFDPNVKSNNFDLEQRRNRVVTDAFEPGSVMKPFVIAKGLKEKKLQPNSKFFCEFGLFKIGKRTIKDSDDKHKYGWLPVTDILAHSSNIGMSKIAFSMGDEIVRSAYDEFGFGQKYGLELPGEGKGTLHPLPWNNHLLANISFGQGISATALQVANAYAALINGGSLNKPYLIEAMKEPETGIITEFKPQLLRQVLTLDESEKMRMMLVAATAPEATGEKARVSGFMVGGKTGTAQMADPKGGGYLKGAYISSFAGFIPAQDPRFVIYIALERPQKAYYGSQVAAPVFSRLASFAVRREGLAPLLTAENKNKQKIKKKAKPPEISQANLSADLQNIPDLKNLTVREVFKKLHGQDVQVRIQGQGTVSETIPSAGDPLGDDKTMTVILR